MPALKNRRWELYAVNLAKGGLSDTDAHEAAGYKRNRCNAGRLKTNENIQSRVMELKRLSVVDSEVEVDDVLREMICRAFYNVAEFFTQDNDDGELEMKPLADLTDAQQRALIIKYTVGRDGEVITQVTFADKDKALDQLARHLQMFKDTLVIENVFRVVQEMSDEDLAREFRQLEPAIRIAAGFDYHPGDGAKAVN